MKQRPMEQKLSIRYIYKISFLLFSSPNRYYFITPPGFLALAHQNRAKVRFLRNAICFSGFHKQLS